MKEKISSQGRICVCGVGFDPVTQEEAARLIADRIKQRGTERAEPFRVVTPNPLMLREAERDSEFRDILNSSDLVLADGTGVVGAAGRRGTPLPCRVTGIGTGYAVAGLIARDGGSIYIMGAAPGRAAAAAERLCSDHPGLKNAGTSDGYADMADTEALLKHISGLSPDLLIICLGMPAQEKWAAEHESQLRGVGAVMCLGGAADVWSGHVRPAPGFLGKIGLEWLWRMLCEPRRFRKLPELIAFRISTRRRRNGVQGGGEGTY